MSLGNLQSCMSAHGLQQRVAAHEVVEEGQQRDGAARIAREAQEERRAEVAVRLRADGLPAHCRRLRPRHEAAQY